MSTPGRNDPCPCGSGLKYKKCHGAVVPMTALVSDEAPDKPRPCGDCSLC
ncbi:MAG: SEC-C metal-binding domain-containing protein, partial [Gammaproteobacteria bacterium]|nr:SEC-C metal-binding domain-containing protein [Gammaproteobacteria bacterium]